MCRPKHSNLDRGSKRIFGENSENAPKRIRAIVPPKVGLSVWQLIKNRIAVKKSLLKRGVAIENGELCDICGLEGDTEAHSIIRCNNSWRLWCSKMDREKVSWCIPSTFKLLLEEWPSLRVKSDPIWWESAPTLSWSIWRARNDSAFNQIEFSFEGVWDTHIMRIMWWIKAWWKECPFCTFDFSQHFEKVMVETITPKVRVVD
ncbi:uncharacterized protein LOC130743868 [Lotus japonicus]|uniref:uncharacterized protein LOC130743868 n=1 Tax=Lotus japonicus TaxID=34305 RepID=UPI0025828E6F|nr:uncharacterized protein LOC130743868 [Lotus japonicus]